MFVLKSSDFSTWEKDRSRLNDWHFCPPANSVSNWSCDLTSNPITKAFPIIESGIYVLIAEHCADNLTSEYCIDAQFLDPNNQHLDSRYVPLLIVLPTTIPCFVILMICSIIFLIFKKQKKT
jgi:hypothetical protein